MISTTDRRDTEILAAGGDKAVKLSRDRIFIREQQEHAALVARRERQARALIRERSSILARHGLWLPVGGARSGAAPSVGSPLPNPAVGPPSQQAIPFRRATTERVGQLPAETAVAIGANEVQIQRNVDGAGYIFGIALRCVANTAGNAAATAFVEDGPWSALSSIVFEDVNAQVLNLTGYDAYIINLINRTYAVRFQDQSTNTNLFQLITGAGATGGSFAFFLRVPVATNRRDLRGLLANQDRAQKYLLRTNVASSGSIYSTAPTVLPTLLIEKYYENYTVPLPQSPTGAAQEIIPRDFGTIHYSTATVSEASPVGGSQINHYIKRLGNTMRWITLIARSNSSRATAETNFPTNIQVKVGEDALFNESWHYRKALAYERFGFDMPNGVIPYDWTHDFAAAAAFEFGDDWIHTQALVNAQYLITWPAGFGSTANSLKFVTDDMQYVEPSAGVAVAA